MPTFSDKSANNSSAFDHGAPTHGGKSPHAFMVEAFGVKTQLLAHRRAFVTAARSAESNAFDDGLGYRAEDVDAYFEALAAETAAVHPQLTTWRR